MKTMTNCSSFGRAIILNIMCRITATKTPIGTSQIIQNLYYKTGLAQCKVSIIPSNTKFIMCNNRKKARSQNKELTVF